MKLDRVALLITDPPPTSFTILSKKEKENKFTFDTLHMTCDTWHVTHDTWYVGKVNLLSEFQLSSSSSFSFIFLFGMSYSSKTVFVSVLFSYLYLFRLCWSAYKSVFYLLFAKFFFLLLFSLHVPWGHALDHAYTGYSRAHRVHIGQTKYFCHSSANKSSL